MTNDRNTTRRISLWWLKPWCWDAGLRESDRRNSLVMSGWCVVWAACFVAATAILKFLEPSMPLALAVVAVPLLPGYFAVRAYLRFLREADELLRKIHLDSLGFGAGVAMAVGTTFLMISPLGASPLWGLTLSLTALSLGYSASVIKAMRSLGE